MSALATPAPATDQGLARLRPAPPALERAHAGKHLRRPGGPGGRAVTATVAPSAGAVVHRAVRPIAPPAPRRALKARRDGHRQAPVLTPGATPRREWDRLQIHAQAPHREQEALAELAQGPLPAPAQQPPDKAAALIVGACVEVLSGHRDAHLLTRRTTPELYDAIARRASLAQRLLGREVLARVPRVRSCRAQQVRPDRAEAVVLLETAGRVRAAAAHMVLRRGRWLLAGLEIA